MRKDFLNMKDYAAILSYAIVSLLPGVLLIFASFAGSGWPLVALLMMTVWVWAMDRTDLPGAARGQLAGLPLAIGALHFLVLVAVIWALRSGWQGSETAALMLAAGLFIGHVSNACAHELIHRPQRRARAVGTAIYCSILNGQHVSAHLLVHHVHAGTARDPNSAPLGQGFYRYFLRASLGEFLAGLKAENRRRNAASAGFHPYLIYLGAGGCSLLCASALAGLAGCIGLVVLSLHAHTQLLLSDYVQHYGLQRKTAANGKPQPMGPAHSWNAPHRYSAALMLAAPFHSDHHTHPGRVFTDLQLDPKAMPMLPYSMPVMAAIALVPPLWRAMMDKRAASWSDAPYVAATAA